ncbi:hypothetical protein EVA_20343 [gut metagenome]|uniref:Uncharacterized protein n=1 Tax=gut metagenome TaxID=749906 RepID=J9BVI4_9ZZZZ
MRRKAGSRNRQDEGPAVGSGCAAVLWPGQSVHGGHEGGQQPGGAAQVPSVLGEKIWRKNGNRYAEHCGAAGH